MPRALEGKEMEVVMEVEAVAIMTATTTGRRKEQAA